MSDSLRNEVFDSENNAWKTRFGVPMYEYYKQNPVNAARFAKAMEGSARCQFTFPNFKSTTLTLHGNLSGPPGLGAGRRLPVGYAR